MNIYDTLQQKTSVVIILVNILTSIIYKVSSQKFKTYRIYLNVYIRIRYINM